MVISKGDGRIETRKYRGEELVCQASGQDFHEAMIHTTIVGLAEDEPASGTDITEGLLWSSTCDAGSTAVRLP